MFDTATSAPARSAWLEGTLRAQEKECRDQLSKDILGTGRRDSTVLWKASADEASCNCVSSVLDTSPSICIGLGNATTKVLRISTDSSRPPPQGLKVDAHEEFRGHRGYVSCILSLTKLLITGSFDGTVCIWRVDDGLLMGISDHHHGPIHNLSFDLQSRSLFSVSSDKTLRCLDLNNGNSRVVCNNLGREIMCCLATPRPHYPNLPWAIYAGSEDGTIFGVDGDTGKKLIKFTGHTDIVQKLALLGAAGQMLSGCRDNSVRRWCLRSGSCLFTYTSHTGPVFDLIPIRSGSECLSASKDGTVQRWDITTGLVQQTYHGHSGAIFGMCIAPSSVGCKLVTAGRDRTVRVWQPVEECEFCVTRCIGCCPFVRQTVQRCLGCEVDLTASQGEHRKGCTEVPRPCQFAHFGCKEMLGCKDMVTHESLCDFRPMRCPNSILGCPHEAPGPDIPAHAVACEYQLVACPNNDMGCSHEGLLKDVRVHSVTCPFGKMECPNGCKSTLLRNQMSSHMTTCPSLRPSSEPTAMEEEDTRSSGSGVGRGSRTSTPLQSEDPSVARVIKPRRCGGGFRPPTSAPMCSSGSNVSSSSSRKMRVNLVASTDKGSSAPSGGDGGIKDGKAVRRSVMMTRSGSLAAKVPFAVDQGQSKLYLEASEKAYVVSPRVRRSRNACKAERATSSESSSLTRNLKFRERGNLPPIANG